MIKRLLSTIALWSIVIGTVYFFHATGGVVLLAVFSTLAQHEFNNLLEKSSIAPWQWATLAFGFVLVLLFGLNLQSLLGETSWFSQRCIIYLWILAAIALTLGALGCVKNPATPNRLAGSVLSVAYVPGMMVFYALIVRDFGHNATVSFPDRSHPGIDDVGLAIWVIAVAKFTDVGGYLVGRAIGKHKLAPSISPGKTWEGVAGGIGLATLVSLAIWTFAPHWMPFWFSPTLALLLPLPIGIAAIISDLSESAFKRRAGVKDSGNCIPGIGGALDLADSLLLAGPVAYALFLSNIGG